MDRPAVPRTHAEIRKALRALAVRPSRRLGQSFLADPGVLARIVAAAAPRTGDLVLEIGPGLGGLTAALAATGASVLAVEIDPVLAAFVRAVFVEEPRVRVLEADALDGRGGLAPQVRKALAESILRRDSRARAPGGFEARQWRAEPGTSRPLQESPAVHAGRMEDPPAVHAGRMEDPPAVHGGRRQDPPAVHAEREGDSPAVHGGRRQESPVVHAGRGGDSPAVHAGREGDSPAVHDGREGDSHAVHTERMEDPPAVHAGRKQDPTAVPPGRFVVAANLPYSAATPIVLALLQREPPPDEMVIMVQREVADRVRAEPGSKAFGPLSVLVQAVARVRTVATVRKEAFHPAPEVASTVLRVTPDPALRRAAGDLARLEALVHAAFSMRRKTLGNNLGKAGVAAEVVRAAGIDPGRRAEALSPAEFIALAAALPSLASRRGGGEDPASRP